MAAVNVGILLCRHFSKKTLIVDWNLASPRSMIYLNRLCSSPTASLNDLFFEYMKLIDGDGPITSNRLAQCLGRVNSTSVTALDYLPASLENYVTENYVTIDWTDFYKSYQGGRLVEYLRVQWEKAYNATLIISEQGLSDASSICTIQLPDVILVMMDMSRGGIQLSSDVIRRILMPGKKMDGREVKILPVLSKLESRVEYSLMDEALEMMREVFSKYLPPGIDSTNYFDQMRIPFIPYYNYSHEIPALSDEGLADPESLLWNYINITKLLVKFIESNP